MSELGHCLLLCLSISQTSRSPVPEICKCKLVTHEERNTTDQIKDCYLPDRDRNHMPEGKPKKRNQSSAAAKYRANLEKHTIVNVSLLRRPKRNYWPPTPIHVGEPIHKILDFSHGVEDGLKDNRCRFWKLSIFTNSKLNRRKWFVEQFLWPARPESAVRACPAP